MAIEKSARKIGSVYLRLNSTAAEDEAKEQAAAASEVEGGRTGA